MVQVSIADCWNCHQGRTSVVSLAVCYKVVLLECAEGMKPLGGLQGKMPLGLSDALILRGRMKLVGVDLRIIIVYGSQLRP